jgi:hypothetical protein
VAGCGQAWETWETWEKVASAGHFLILDPVGLVFDVGFFFLPSTLGFGLSPRALFFGGGLADVPFVVDVRVLAWPWSRPESSRAVVRSRGENVAKWMPVHAPDVIFVCERDLVCGKDGLC